MSAICNRILDMSWCESAPIRSPTKKWGLTALAATALALSLIGVAYGTCGFTSVAHRVWFLHALTTLNTTQLSMIIVGWSAASCCGFVALIVLHRPPKPYVVQEVLEALDQLELQCSFPKKSFRCVKEFLRNGFSNYLDYYGFYHHLATLSQHILSQPPEYKEHWDSFLQQINGIEVDNWDYSLRVTIDCTQEYNRANGVQTKIEIEEFKQEDSPTFDTDIITINRICREAFSQWGRGNKINYFFENGNPFVFRDAEREILGIIVLQEITNPQTETKSLHFHTLARKASAVKLKLTEQFLSKHIASGTYEKIYCLVLQNNLPAQRVYKNNGFTNSGSYTSPGYWFSDAYIMTLYPNQQKNKIGKNQPHPQGSRQNL